MYRELIEPIDTGEIDAFGDKVYQFSEKVPPFEEEEEIEIKEIMEIETVNSQPSTVNLLLRDNWYALHPEKILGEPYEASGRYGTVIKYRGSIDLLNRIVTGIDLDNLPVISEQLTVISEQPTTTEDLITEHERLVNVLESPSHLDDLQEAAVQKQELEELKAVVPTSDINESEFEDLKLAFPSIKRNENGAVYIPSSANDEKYIRKKALEKNIRLGKLTFVNDLTDLYDVYIEDFDVNGMKESYDLGFGSLGAGITVWNRKKQENGDYQHIAHIYEDGSIKYYIALPAFVKKEIEEIAENNYKKEVDLDKKYGLNFETTSDGDMVIVTSTLSTTNGEPNTIARINTSNGSFQYKKSFLAPELEEILAKEAKQYENNPSYRKVEIEENQQLAEAGIAEYNQQLLDEENGSLQIANSKPTNAEIAQVEIPNDSPEIPQTSGELAAIANEPDTTVIEIPSATPLELSTIISASKAELAEKTLRKVEAKKAVEEYQLPVADMQSFEEVYRLYNQDISLEELRAFIYYKESIGQELSLKWYTLADTDLINGPNMSGKLDYWINEGILFYHRGKLIPAFLYLAENIWHRVSDLEQDKATIIERYGQAVYDRQYDTLNKLFLNTAYKNRLILDDTEDGKSLSITPVSTFAQNFKIKTLADELPFKLKVMASGVQLLVDVRSISAYKLDEVAELSLTDAFVVWMVKNQSTIEYKKQVSYVEIYKAYIKQSPRPRPQGNISEEKWKAEWERIKENAQIEGDRLFAYFLANELTLNDKVRIETEWNSQFNGYIPINYNKIPVAFPLARTMKGEFLDVRPEKREAVAFLFNSGSGLLGYDVGFGKTPSCIFAIRQAMEAGYAKRPLIAVPNQVYRQFMSEFRGFMPDVPLVDLYNLSSDYMDELKGENGVTMQIPEGSVAFVTYEGLEKIGFNKETQDELMESLYEILENVQADKDLTPRQREQFISKIETTLGVGLRGTIVTVEDLGIDLLAVDEAHNMKKVFTRVSSEGTMGETEKGDLKISREKSPYKIESGQPSARGLKAFMLAQYIQKRNNGRNVFLLTATPFTNSPLEVYSMLALTAYNELRKSAINNIRTFFDQYIETAHQLVIDAKLNPVRKQVVTGFRNLPALQQLIFKFINFKNGDTKNADGTPAVNVVRPNKWTLPLRYKMVDGQIVPLSEDEKISTVLPMTSEQADIMADIRLYVEGKVSYEELCSISAKGNVYSEETDDEDDLTDTDAEILDEGSLDDEEKMAVKMLRGISMARNIAISPFLFECYGVRKPSAKEFIESSPKLQYALLCIKQVKDYAKEKGVMMPGQVIYMDRGKEFFNLIKQYFVSELGFKDHEIQIVTSGMPKTGNRSKEAIKNLFNGQTYNEATRTFDEVPDSERVKVVIGTSTIKEGMNLQKYATHLYNLTVDWNPTDYQQLEGRIWRQGNSYKNVAIATALVENSMDIFIFQKLEEKSRRINQIWNRDGQSSVFKFEEFNPEDAKYEMISDPTILAKLEIEEQESKLRDQMAGIESEIRRIVTIRQDHNVVELFRERLTEEAKRFRTLSGDETIDQLIRKIQNVEQTQLDEEELNKPIKDRKKFTEKYQKEEYRTTNWYVGQYGYKVPDYLKNLNAAHRRNKKDEASYLVPRGLTFDILEAYQGELKTKMDAMAEEIKVMSSENTLAEHIKMVIERKAANKVETRSVQDRAKEAAKLNWIITERLESSKSKVQSKNNVELSTLNIELESCPPTDAKGVLRIDAEAIAQLNRCIAAAPQTKYLHLIEGTEEYTPVRKALHKKLIAHAMGDAICIERTKPIAILTGGLPGSGKSTYLQKHAAWLLSDKVMHIDADAIRAELPEYKGWNANATHLETKDIVNELLDTIGKPCNHDLVYDGTMNKAKNYIPLVEKLKNLGYEVFVIYFLVPYEVSMERTLTRYQKTGRYVPTEVITEAYQAGTTALETIKSMVNGYRLIDGVSGETLETGGMPIPADRNYDLPDNANQPTPTEKATKLKLRLELLQEMVAENPENEKLKLRVELLEEMILEL